MKRLFLFLPLLLSTTSSACTVVVFDPLGSTAPAYTSVPTLSTTSTSTLSTTETKVVEEVVCNVKAKVGLNLRSGAGTSFPSIGYLEEGAVVVVVDETVVEEGSTWKKVVETGSGKTGWVNGKYLCSLHYQ